MKKLCSTIVMSLVLLATVHLSECLAQKIVVVSNNLELKTAVDGARSGQTIMLLPGRYEGNITIRNVNGNIDEQIVIKGIDKDNKPVIFGGDFGIHLSQSNYVSIKDLIITDSKYNGINIDDGGNYQTPSLNNVIENLDIYHIGGNGNHDGLKLSGVQNFLVSNVRILGWGGSAIDMVGCHYGRITGCHFEGINGFSQRNGVQAKGGSSDIFVENSFFKNAGQNSVVIGGHTGREFFRPKGINYEATRIRISGNRFYGSNIPIAWGTALGGIVSQNTIVFPKFAIVRIYQGTKDPFFRPCQGGVFSKNLVIIGKLQVRVADFKKGTLPKSFKFRANAWYSPDNAIIENLPGGQENGIYHINPELRDIGNPQMRSVSNDERITDKGAESYYRQNPSK